MQAIRIESPFDTIYDSGIVFTEDDKTYVKLRKIGATAHLTRMTFPRYLMCVKLNRILEPNELVRRINKKDLSNNIDNFTVYTMYSNKKELASKIQKIKAEPFKPFMATCSYCGGSYLRKTKIIGSTNFCSPTHQRKFNNKINIFNTNFKSN